MKNNRRYIIALIIGLAVVVITAFAEGILTRNEINLVMKDLSNAFFVSAVITGGVGLLTVCSAGGTFDMLRFSSRKFFGLFRINTGKNIKGPDFYEYRRAKDEKRRPQWFLVLIGAVFLFLSFIFLMLFYMT